MTTAILRPRIFRIEGLDLTLNPGVVFLALGWLWAFIIWNAVKPEESMGEWWWWKRRIEMAFIWLYYATRNIWVIFLGWLYFSKFGKYVLGADQEDTEVEYSDASWAAMMFSTGMGIALFYFGVSEPVFHFNQSMQSSARAQSFFSVDIAAQEGIMLTFFNFGLHAWAPFVLIGIAVAWAHYRQGLPFAVRSIFYPLLGKKINGWMGDIIDVVTALASFCGIAVSMGLCAIMVSAGINWESYWIPYIGIWSEAGIQNYEVMVIVLWITSSVAVISVCVGLASGARTFVALGMIFSSWVMFAVFFMDDSWYVLNVMTQSVGYYLFYLVKLGHHVDAFQKSDAGVDTFAGTTLSPWFDGWQGDGANTLYNKTDLAGFMPAMSRKNGPAFGTNDYEKVGMTGIYWGWWVSMAPVVGIFMAKISKGRTIRSLIRWGLGFPVVVCFFWISVFGGLGIKMERRALIDGCRCNCDTTSLAGTPFDRMFCDSIAANPYGQTALGRYYEGIHPGEQISRNVLTCEDVRPAVRGQPGGCSSIVQLSTLRPERMWFALLDEYMTGGWTNGAKNMGRFLGGVTIAALIAWLIAMMDTGSFVIDQIMSNGEDKPHRFWRLCMLFTMIALTCVLVRAGAKQPMYDSAVALQTLSFVMGMVLFVFLTALPVCIYSALNDEEKDAPHPAIDVVKQDGSHDIGSVYPTCKAVGDTNGHALTYPEDWTIEEHAEHASINMWTHPVGGGFFDCIDFFFTCSRSSAPAIVEIPRLITSLIAPCFVLPRAYARIDTQTKCYGLSITPFIAIGTACAFWGWFSLLIVEAAPFWYNGDSTTTSGWKQTDEGMWALAWICYMYLAFIVACCRYNVRQILKIKGNLVQDFFLSLFFYPLVVAQMDAQRLPRPNNKPKAIQAAIVQPVGAYHSMPVISTFVPIPVPMMSIQHAHGGGFA